MINPAPFALLHRHCLQLLSLAVVNTIAQLGSSGGTVCRDGAGSAAQFAATACTIVSGAIAERAKFETYILYSFFMAAWVRIDPP